MGKKPAVLRRTYPAKLILFGEYTVLLDSDILAIPLKNYSGKLVTDVSEPFRFEKDFLKYLKQYALDFLYLDKIEELSDGKVGLSTTIPIGWGLGSSGALTAAVYEFAKKNHIESDLEGLQQRLGIIESFFHGKSSGFDPLVSLLNKAVWKSHDNGIKIIDLTRLQLKKCQLYLLDSTIKRTNKGLIPLFLQMAQKDNNAYRTISQLNNEIIQTIIHGKHDLLPPLLKKLSETQYRLMQPMIIDEIKSLWLKGLKSNQYYLKICGGGGGGFYMCWSKTSTGQIGNYKLTDINLCS